MCTVVFNFDPSADYPFILIGNRDEMVGRPSRAPAYHWDDRPEVLGGLDEEAGGTWMAVNAHGVFATLLNRKQALGPAPGKRSRGELPLDALEFEAAADAAEAMGELDPLAYRPFNLIIADSDAVFLVQNDGEREVTVQRADPGLHMISHSNLNDPSDARVRWFRDAFDHLGPPRDPARLETWQPWADLMASPEGMDPKNPITALSIETDFGFGTVSSALFALDQDGGLTWFDRTGRPRVDNFHEFSLLTHTPAR